jgi:hypothetical protein
MLRLPEPFIDAEIAYRRDQAIASLSTARHGQHFPFLSRLRGRRRSYGAPSGAQSPGLGQLATTQHG